MALEGVTGISGAIGYAPETTWGTSVAPSKWMEFLAGETLGRKQNYQRSAGIKAGRTFATGGRTAATTRTAGGNLGFEFPTKGAGAWLNLLHGLEVTPAKTLTETYTQVHKFGTSDPYKKSMTIVKAAPKTAGGVVDSYCYSGSILNSLELALATNGYLVARANIDAKDEDQTQTIGTVSYPTGVENFTFVQAEILINSVKQEFLRDMKVVFNKPTDTSRFMLGSATRLQPVTNAFNDIKIDFTADYNAKTLYEFFKEATTKKVEINIVGNAMAVDVTKFELKLVFPMCRFEGDSPNISDLGPLKQTIPLMVEDNGTEPPCTATYVSTDSAL
jgi:hypothetical protein